MLSVTYYIAIRNNESTFRYKHWGSTQRTATTREEGVLKAPAGRLLGLGGIGGELEGYKRSYYA